MPSHDLSVVCVTKGEGHAKYFIEYLAVDAKKIGAEFVLGIDCDRSCLLDKFSDIAVFVNSEGFVEDVLDIVISKASSKYILRIDDDEGISAGLLAWLADGFYKHADVWSFPRMNLWDGGYIGNEPLWPDYQTRLAKKELSMGRAKEIHSPSASGAGMICDKPILHHKFLVKNYEQRKAMAKHYESLKKGGGLGPTYKPFTLPEDCFEKLDIRELPNGS